MGVPEPSINGGLYTGEPFAEGAQYADIKVQPDAFFMNHITLQSANPPPGAMEQAVDNDRPGNNQQYITEYKNINGILCKITKDIKKPALCAHNSFEHQFGSM
jgi:hypothetical protein